MSDPSSPLTGEHRPLRVAVLTGPFSSTQDAQLTALRDRKGAAIEIVYRRASADAPFDEKGFASLQGATAWDDEIPAEQVQRLVDRLQPDVLLVTSWNYGAYVKIARAWRNRALRAMFMDNPWRGTPKQWAGLAISPLYLKPAFDVVFVPNERQRVFAKKLGFREEQMWYGAYCCDQPRFEANASARQGEGRAFLYVGRLVRSKGVEVLLEAYAAYRRQVVAPWPLHIAGTGPLRHLLANADGVVSLGFNQPSAIPGVFAAAGCFILPSLFEPWGTVIHEATASGVPVICTTACGASLDLVRDGYNGFTVPPGGVRALTDAMVLMSTMESDRRQAMGQASISLSRQLTPQRWADNFDERARAWLARAEERRV
ncbi:MAG: glycosyltransferase family 4 protein [Actinobacteria bacterium]|nr:glycosyltransferase family 4 protein [Actinomycetota bacterium]